MAGSEAEARGMVRAAAEARGIAGAAEASGAAGERLTAAAGAVAVGRVATTGADGGAKWWGEMRCMCCC